MLLILTPLKAEAEPVLACLGDPEGALSLPEPACVRTYRVGRGAVAAGWTGIGAENTRRAVSAAVRAASPRAVLHLGVAGGLSPSLRVGDVVICERLLREGGEAIDCPAAHPVSAWLPAAGTRGASLTVERVVTGAADKRALHERTAAHVVEMESYWAAEAARALAVPFGCVRVVVDEQDVTLPDLTDALDQVGRPRTLRLLRRLVSSPGTIAALPRVARAFGQAQAALGRVAQEVADKVYRTG